MWRKGSYITVFVLSAGSMPCLVLAQAADPKIAPPVTESSAPAPAERPSESAEAPETQYAAALNSTGLISLDSRAEGHLLLGATITGGWDSNANSIPNGVATGLYTVAPYVGIQKITPTLRALVQYQFTNTSSGSTYGNQSIHLGSVMVLKSVTDRFSWDMKLLGSYGQDSLRFLASPQTVAIGGVPGVGPNSASYLTNAGTATHLDGDLGFNFRASQRDTVELRVDNVFSNYTGLTGSNSVATTSLTYERSLSPTFGAVAYQQSSFYYGALRCQSYGAGLGLRWRPREQSSLSLSGGPQLDAASCGNQQRFAFSASLNTKLTGKSQFYLLSSRQPTTSYLGPGLWQDSASGGYQRQVTSIGVIGVDAGYVTSDTLATVSGYRGAYFSASYDYQLGHGIQASYGYRGYLGDTGGARFSRNVVQFSIAWTPGAGHVFQ